MLRLIGTGVWGNEEAIKGLVGELEKRAGLTKPEPAKKSKKRQRSEALDRIAGLVKRRGGKVKRG
jgi:hypothetical protein